MRVMHVPFGYFPDPVGGTEHYVRSLIHCLRQLGVVNAVLAPGSQQAEYRDQDSAVYRYRASPDLDLPALYAREDPAALTQALGALDAWQPEVLHVHALTAASGPALIEAAKARGISTVLTCHTPTLSCQRGDLMRHGRELCDGRLDLARCTACVWQQHGMPAAIAHLLAALPAFCEGLSRVGVLPERARRAAALPGLMARTHAAVRRALDAADHIVAVCQWVYELLRGNGVAAPRLSLSRQGVPMDVSAPPQRTPSRGHVIALGRAHPTKGFDVLLRALDDPAAAHIEAELYLVAQDEDAACVAELEALGRRLGPRLRIIRNAPRATVLRALAEAAVLVIPSRWPETGPLVMLEALQLKVPVLASDRGGMAEVLPGYRACRLFRTEDAAHLRSQLLAMHAQALPVQEAVRDMPSVAAEHHGLYARLCGRPAHSGAALPVAHA